LSKTTLRAINLKNRKKNDFASQQASFSI